MEQHDKTGRAVAAFLEEHPKVMKVYYPGSASHPQNAVARRQQKGFGGMVAFEVGSLDAARTVWNLLSYARLPRAWAELKP